MDRIIVSAASRVSEADVRAARLGEHFRRLDLASRLVLLAVERLGIDFDALPRDRIGICLASQAGSLAADSEYWSGRGKVGGPSPTQFAYTLPSVAIGEVAIRHRLTGPNLCLIGEDVVLVEAGDWLRRGEVEACICVSCHLVTPAVAELIHGTPAAGATAVFLRLGGDGSRALEENDRDIDSLSAVFCAHNGRS